MSRIEDAIIAFLSTGQGQAVAVCLGVAVFLFALIFMGVRHSDEDDYEEEEETVEDRRVSDEDYERRQRSIMTVMTMGGITLTVVAVMMAYPSVYSYLHARAVYSQTKSSYTQDISASVDSEGEREITGEVSEYHSVDVDSAPSWMTLDVDFESLVQENSDIIGWLVVDGIDIINYPIVQADDDSYYLTHSFTGEENSSGAIFLAAGSSPDFIDAYSIIYGHNMKDGSMFGSLKKFEREESSFDVRATGFTIYTAGHAYRYRIFSYCTLKSDDEIYSLGFTNGTDEFSDLVDRLFSASERYVDLSPDTNSRIVTLSTCSYSDSVRFTVHGMLMEVYDY
ncbi:MAG: class B sortase [Eubacterium sp.]|nr:class B sortase [Eubacterium sp.]